MLALIRAALRSELEPIREELRLLAERKTTGNGGGFLTVQDAANLIKVNPCVLKRGDLPKKRDKDPSWREGAVFTRDEVEQIISDERVPEDRRVLDALLFLGGLRFGESAALRMRDYDASMKPLGRLMVTKSYSTKKRQVKSVKTEQPRTIPVHPTLAKILARWKLRGWQEMMGRAPRADDLLIPSRLGVSRNSNHMLRCLHEDLERMGLRSRRQHDMRRTFVTLALADGARRDILDVDLARASWRHHERLHDASLGDALRGGRDVG